MHEKHKRNPPDLATEGITACVWGHQAEPGETGSYYHFMRRACGEAGEGSPGIHAAVRDNHG